MKKVLNKAICFAMSILMIISALPISTYASVMGDLVYSEDGQWGYREIYSNDEETVVELSYYSGNAQTVTVPSKIDGCRVVGMANTFASNKTVRNITVSEGIEYIGFITFSGCKDLSITLPNSLKYISGERAFGSATIKSINFPRNLEYICSQAFSKTTFTNTEFTLPNSLKYIESRAFAESNVEKIHLGDNVRITSVYWEYYGVEPIAYDYEETDSINPFANSSLNEISVYDSNPYFTVENDCLMSKDKETIYTVFCNNKDFIVDDQNVRISYDAFTTANINNLIISNNLENLDNYRFAGANVKDIVFEYPSKIKDIGTAFEEINTNYIILPSSVENIKEYAFNNSKIVSVCFDKNSKCKYFDDYAFNNCTKLESVFIPNSVISLSNKPFAKCTALKNIVFEDNSKLSIIEKDVFSDSHNIYSIEFGENSALTVFNAIMKSGYMRKIDFSNTNLVGIGDECFNNSYISEVVLPESCIKIGKNAFYSCDNLKSINLENVIEYGDNAFADCNSEIVVPKIEAKQNDDFVYIDANNQIYINSYIGENMDVVIPNEIDGKPVTYILDSAFKDLKITSIKFPNGLKHIGDYAFYNCRYMKCAVDFPDTIEYIGAYAFNDVPFERGSTIVIPKNVTTIFANTFEICRIKLDLNNVVCVCKNAFNYATFYELTIPESVEYMDDGFYNCYFDVINLNSSNVDIRNLFYRKTARKCLYEFDCINVGENVESYSSENGVLFNKDKTELIIFPMYSSITEYKVPSTVKTIKSFAFAGNDNLEAIELNHGLENIEEYAFQSMSNSISDIYLPNTLTNIGDYAFAESRTISSVEFEENSNYYYVGSAFAGCTSLDNVKFNDNISVDTMSFTFNRCTALKDVDLNCKVEFLCAFEESGLETIKLYDGIEIIGNCCFDKTNIQKIVLPDTVKMIEYRAFYKCEDLSYINLANTKILEDEAFAYCTSLESIDLTGVLYYSKDSFKTFEGCDKLKKFYFTADEKEAYIAENEFSGDDQIETVVIGNNITEIQDYAFANCTNLETALIADEVEDISDTAFENCEKLTIVCEYNSPAMYYAQKNDIKYETVQSFVVSPIPDQTYTGKAIKPSLTVKQGANNLTANVDYSATYSNNINVGKAKVVVTGLGDYKIFGTTVNFNIVEPTHTHSYTSVVTKAASCGANGVRTYTCSCGSSYTQTINATGNHTYKTYTTKATKTANGKIETKCTGCGKISSTKTVYYPKTYTLSTTTYTYDGKVKTPTLTIKDYKGNTLKKDRDYKITYPSGRKSLGKYTYKITFIGNYSGTATKTFTIKPKATSISKLTAKSKGFTVTWKKQSTQTTGYQIQIATDSKFTKGVKSYTVSKNSTTSKSITKLTGKKKYFVRIRTYKTVKVNGKNAKIYSSWSGSKYVTTKK